MQRFKDIKAFTGLRKAPTVTADVENVTLLEGFEWYSPDDGAHWKRLARLIPDLKHVGIDTIWIPPGCKAGWLGSNGYDTYDLYDLGEFEQKGALRTKWGTKSELLAMMTAAEACNIGILWDGVLNHKAAADFTERCHAVTVDKADRRRETSKPQEVEVWTGYSFPGRKGKYSSMQYHWVHFSGTNYEARLKSGDHIYKFIGKGKPGWAQDVDKEDGNADYLMFNDLDYAQKDVCDDVKQWGTWISKEVGLSGFRLDAVKHFSRSFLKEWIAHLDQELGKKLFMVGEYWVGDVDALRQMIADMEGRLHLFDAPLAGNFSRLSQARRGDMRTILEDTLVNYHPNQSVAFVENHDTQERFERDHSVQPVEAWFKPHAYAFILLRGDVGTPCVFFGDLYGTLGAKPHPPSCFGKLPLLIKARKLYAYGPQKDYIDDANTIGFTRQGLSSRSGGAGVAVVMNIDTSYAPAKRMHVGEQHTGEEWTDILRFAWGSVTIDSRGYGEFPVGPRSVSVWVNSRAVNRHEIDRLKFKTDIYEKS